MKRFLVIALLVILGGGGFFASWQFMRSPYWSLYQIGKAIHNHDARLFLAYVDLDRIIRSQKDELVSEFMGEDSDQKTQQTVQNLLSAFMQPIVALARDRVINAVADPDRDNLPTSWALVPMAKITVNGNYALVVLSDPEKQRRLRLGMTRHPEQGHWQVVQVDPRDAKILLREYLKNERASEQPEEQTQQSSPKS